MRRPAVMAGAAVLLFLSAALDAQWLKYPNATVRGFAYAPGSSMVMSMSYFEIVPKRSQKTEAHIVENNDA